MLAVIRRSRPMARRPFRPALLLGIRLALAASDLPGRPAPGRDRRGPAAPAQRRLRDRAHRRQRRGQGRPGQGRDPAPAAEERNPRTLTLLAGDALSPSALGTARVNGEPLAGRQMVAVLNRLGLDARHLRQPRIRPQRTAVPWIGCGNPRFGGSPAMSPMRRPGRSRGFPRRGC